MCHGQIIDHAIRKARKSHRCTECGGEIAPGRRYEWARVVDGRDAWSSKLCRPCSAFLTIDQEANYDGCSFEPRERARDIAHEEGWRGLLARARAAVAKWKGAPSS